jgi:outer membrane protein OmpA-like peptidoglycan-associated protein
MLKRHSQKAMIVGISACAMLAACSTAPPAALEQARLNYRQAEQDPRLTGQASVPLYEANQTLLRAERVWHEHHDSDEVEHLAYVTDRKIEVARAEAQRKIDEARARDLRQEAQRLAELRGREAEQAKRLAEQREVQAQVAREQEQARAREADQARLAADLQAREAERVRRESEAKARAAELAQMQADQARQNEQEARARMKQLELQLSDLKARETERGLELTLSGVLYDFDKAALTPGALRSLAPLVTFLQENPDRTIAIEGHTDSLGSDAYNQQLSQRRAEAVRDFLVQNGISAARISARGMGESYPVASNNTEAGRQQNRRVEIVISNQEQRTAQQNRQTSP